MNQTTKLEPQFRIPFIITKVLPNDGYVSEDLPYAERTQRHCKAVFASDQLKIWCMLPLDDSDDIDEEDESTMGEVTKLGQESRLYAMATLLPNKCQIKRSK
uniref:Uncharacterized protein n=1 Tax=Bactrocera latifrons TaxID=174628 RepID=A0A0K8W0U6_BACLA